MPKKNMRVNILEASVKLLKTYGYMKTSIDDISQAVGLTKGGVYHSIEEIIENINTVVLHGISKTKSGGRVVHGDIV
jgi:hypothetical protein